MIIRARAPLRLGLGGGGTDISPYSDEFGGCVLNATIDIYAYCTLVPRTDGVVRFISSDLGITEIHKSESKIQSEKLKLHAAIYNRIVKDFNHNKPLSFDLTTFCEVPAGSGLGSSSTMVVSILTAFCEWLHLPLGEYDIAHLAFEIERKDANLSGGKQDQYAATFGGFNFIEFGAADRVIVNPLRIKSWIVNELELQTVLFFTGQSRSSAEIIDQQVKNTTSHDSKAVTAMHELKSDCIFLKEQVLKGNIREFAEILGKSWLAKKKTASSVSNNQIDSIYNLALSKGAYSGKVSGAGGGGFMFFMVPPECRTDLINSLKQLNGQVINFHFTPVGAQAWTI